MIVALMYYFRSLSNKLLRFLKFNYNFTSQVRLFFSVEKRKPKIFGLKKYNGKRNPGNQKQCLSLVILEIASKIFGKIILKPL